MKKNALMVPIIILLGIILVKPIYGADDKMETQRFRLFNAEYNSALTQMSKTTVFTEKRLFKIDSKTGDAWMLIDVLRDGQDIKYWKKIENENK